MNLNLKKWNSWDVAGRLASMLVLLAAVPCIAASEACVQKLYVNASTGSDRHDGHSPSAALQTIQAAADRVQPGDEVIIYPGIYNERVVLSNRFSSASAWTVFRADVIAKGRVVLTCADPVIRGGADWKLEDAARGLYSVPYTKAKPCRVLYDGVDLYHYPARSNLETFTTTDTRDGEGNNPGPRHGWFYDVQAKKLYVRLHASGQYGSADPRDHVMAVSPKEGYAFKIEGSGPAHIRLDGITFETPGLAAIHTEASAVTIQNCWFFGCPYGVRGNNTGRATRPGAGPYDTASEIVIQQCEFTDKSPYRDVLELLALRQAAGEKAVFGDFWHRKAGGRRGFPEDMKGYENGIACQMGRDWVIRGNYIHDIFEGLANDSMSFSVGAQITGNVFARLCDNGIETENHATNVVIRQNVFLDVFEPFSYQPLKGTNWPGDIEFSQNIIANTPGPQTTLWTNGPNEARAVFKIGISLRNWKPRGPLSTNDVPKSPLAVPGGARFYNNSVYFPGGRLINVMGDARVPLGNTFFENNLFAAEFLYSRNPADDLVDGHFDFANNLVTLAEVYSPVPNSPGDIAAGSGGAEYPDHSTFWKDPDSGDFSLVTNSPAQGAGSVAGYPNVGAIQPGDSWFPLAVGPGSAVTNFDDY